MRQRTVSMLRSSRGWDPCLPRPGTKVRRVYDALYASRGRLLPREEHQALIDEITSTGFTNIIKNLRDFWGCDVRRIRGFYFCYSMVGEWCGKVYLDYTDPAVRRAEETS